MGTDVIVVGAGVIGLSTAIRLAESGATVRVWAAEPPAETTSAVAAALWGPDFADPGRAWAYATGPELTRLAADPATGVRLCRGTQSSDIQSEPPPWVDRLPDVRMLEPGELAPGMLVGLRTTVPIVDMPRYLDYLTARLDVEIEIRRIASLAEPAAEAPVVVNCTGVGARELTGDEGLRPWWGQHVVVANPGLDEFYIEAVRGHEWAGFFPHGDVVVLGGVSRPDVWDRTPDPLVAAGIVARCAAIDARLADAPVVGHRVGLRPWRASPRLERERLGDAAVVHNYGHGGMGVSHSWGSADAVVALV
ncbi:FAD-dependent oxidoreductase [Actinokineospora cianjurensis]|uniref:D-amino-acid oxidase n=1 Tax=Actinokineospora cianjurensis TaxID=585224 RepID=A0A421B4M5_9PSEU|nr:FAD-dependent oxidoreductase [Actinokineospora cianjurensis]RLK59304.1 D-amino-acid:oxygen oxidoreductase (deaminating) [Actinokineospora cianjurensis]